MSYDTTFANPTGRISRARFIPALVVLLLAAAFYVLLVHAGRNGEWVLVTLLFPAFVLHARRLHDMGRTAWLLAAPYALIGAAVWQHMSNPNGAAEGPLAWIALAVAAAFVVWGLLGKGQSEANRYGAAA